MDRRDLLTTRFEEMTMQQKVIFSEAIIEELKKLGYEISMPSGQVTVGHLRFLVMTLTAAVMQL